MIAGLESVTLLSGEDALKAEITTMIERISVYFEDEKISTIVSLFGGIMSRQNQERRDR